MYEARDKKCEHVLNKPPTPSPSSSVSTDALVSYLTETWKRKGERLPRAPSLHMYDYEHPITQPPFLSAPWSAAARAQPDVSAHALNASLLVYLKPLLQPSAPFSPLSPNAFLSIALFP